MNDRPHARTDHLVTERIEDELVIYDQVNQVAHCLSPDAASVWDLCDGSLSQEQIARELSLPQETVRFAVDSLRERRLLHGAPVTAPGYSRREAAIRLAKIGGAALAAPVVYSVDVGSAAAAASHLAAGCPLATCGSCVQTNTGGCALCSTAGSTGTNAACLSGRCYCSIKDINNNSVTQLRCAVGSVCRGDFLTGVCTGTTDPRCDCATASQCCGNNCVNSQCRSKFGTTC